MVNYPYFGFNNQKSYITSDFYKNVFGWELSEEYDMPELSFVDKFQDETYEADQKNISVINVHSLEEYIIKIISNGGQVIISPYDVPNGRKAYCHDIDGTVFGMFEQTLK